MNADGPPDRFLAAGTPYDRADWVLLGCPLEETVTFRPGTRQGPAAIRPASQGLETYSPLLRRDLEEVAFCDWGDLDLPPLPPLPPASGRGDQEVSSLLDLIRNRAARILDDGKRPFILGGEHLLTLPLVEAALSRHPGLTVVQLDAHADLRESYEGRRLSHATVMRRVIERSEDLALVQAGVRSGTREEMDFARRSTQVQPATPDNLFAVLDAIVTGPIHLSLDLDVLDPGTLPGTGTPEPGGWTFRELEGLIHRLKGRRVVSADVVELSPGLDPTGVSAVTAARCVREILLAC